MNEGNFFTKVTYQDFNKFEVSRSYKQEEEDWETSLSLQY